MNTDGNEQRFLNLSAFVQKLVLAAQNLSDDEVDGLAVLAGEPAVRGPSPDVGSWLKQICEAERIRRTNQDVHFPTPPDWSRWTDVEVAGGLQAVILLSTTIMPERVYDFMDCVLLLVGGVAVARLREKQITANN